MSIENKNQEKSTTSLNYTTIGQAIDANNTKSISPWVDSTGLRTNDLKLRSLTNSNVTRIAEEFLINSRLIRNNRENDSSILHYFEDSTTTMLSMAEQRETNESKTIPLPPTIHLHMELEVAIKKRRSRRIYTGDPLQLEYLSTLIKSSVGYSGKADVTLTTGETVTLRFRTTPSGGGLNPVQMYVAVLNVNKLKKSIYKYQPLDHSLIEVGNEQMVNSFLKCFAIPEEVVSLSRANALLLLVAQPWRAMRKYGHRGLRLVFMEAGYISQNIHLAACGLGVGSLDCAAIYDDEAHEALNIDGTFTSLIHTVVVGGIE